MSPDRRRLLAAQALYYGVTGVWPLVDIRSFEGITGAKLERWLVKTVGVLVSAIGASLGLAAVEDRGSRETAILALGSAVGLGAIDFVYVAKRRISPVYLADGLAQAAIAWAWLRRGSGAAGSG